jgi:hypothetical protein
MYAVRSPFLTASFLVQKLVVLFNGPLASCALLKYVRYSRMSNI